MSFFDFSITNQSLSPLILNFCAADVFKSLYGCFRMVVKCGIDVRKAFRANIIVIECVQTEENDMLRGLWHVCNNFPCIFHLIQQVYFQVILIVRLSVPAHDT